MANEITVRTDLELGVWQGLGGAITEATAYNFAKLSPQKQRQLLNAYYGKGGLDYNWGRISIGSNDFCLKPFEYTERSDLKDFSIEHDRQYLIPLLQKILSQKSLKIVASPWSPPSCLKLTFPGKLGSVLKPWCFDAYAKYLRKWIESYQKEGIDINFITPQNEPHAVQIWESCLYSYRAQRKLAYKYLARELKDYQAQILLWDHNKNELTKTADKLLSGKFATGYGIAEKIAGIGYHWYDGVFPGQMWQVRQKYPDILMLSTEMSCGFSPYDPREWQHDANLYLRELFSDINAGTNAWIDWNMLLDWRGGPTYCDNFLKSPVILNQSDDDFVLTPIYEALRRFAKLFPADSEVVRCEYDSNKIVATARKTKKGYKVVVANISDQRQEVVIKLGEQKKTLLIAKSEIIGGDMWT